MRREPAAERRVDRCRALPHVGHGVAAGERIEMQRFRGQAQRDALVDDVDRVLFFSCAAY
jgi:hypothetical protein